MMDKSQEWFREDHDALITIKAQLATLVASMAEMEKEIKAGDTERRVEFHRLWDSVNELKARPEATITDKKLAASVFVILMLVLSAGATLIVDFIRGIK